MQHADARTDGALRCRRKTDCETPSAESQEQTQRAAPLRIVACGCGDRCTPAPFYVAGFARRTSVACRNASRCTLLPRASRVRGMPRCALHACAHGAQADPEVIGRQISEATSIKRFGDAFAGGDASAVTTAQFVSYYDDLSATIPDDREPPCLHHVVARSIQHATCATCTRVLCAFRLAPELSRIAAHCNTTQPGTICPKPHSTAVAERCLHVRCRLAQNCLLFAPNRCFPHSS